jgi:peptide deformylase
MIKNLMHDPIFLAGKSEAATKEDLQVAQDLLDTLIANKDACVGLAANMSGVRKRIVVFDNEGT